MAVKIYGSNMCEDTVAAIEKFDELKLDYEFVNITESMDNLSAFLKIRDNDENFVPVKERGGVGIPFFVKEDDSGTLDIEEVLP